MRMEEIKSKLASSELGEREKYDLIIKTDSEVRQKLYGGLMLELKENPTRELEAWEVHLLLTNGESVTIKRIGPDGHELTAEEIAQLLQGPFPTGEDIKPEDVLRREGIIIKRYWVHKEK